MDLGLPQLAVGPAAQLGEGPLRYQEIGVVEPPRSPVAALASVVVDLAARVATLESRMQAIDDARLLPRLRRFWAACVRWWLLREKD